MDTLPLKILGGKAKFYLSYTGEQCGFVWGFGLQCCAWCCDFLV